MPSKLHYRAQRKLLQSVQAFIDCIERRTGVRIATTSVCDVTSISSGDDRAYPAPLVSPSTLAKSLGISVKTLANWRSTGTVNLPFISIGSRVFYRQCDVDAFVKGSVMLSTSERRAKK